MEAPSLAVPKAVSGAGVGVNANIKDAITDGAMDSLRGIVENSSIGGRTRGTRRDDIGSGITNSIRESLQSSLGWRSEVLKTFHTVLLAE